MDSSNKTISEIKNLVRSLTKTWIEKRIEDLYPFFHENVIVMPPGSDKQISGRNDMVESYRQFVNKAVIRNFEEMNLQVNVFNNTAIANLTFKIVYEIQDEVFSEIGIEVLILNNFNNEWKIVWRTQIPVAEK
jgi:hypothetical protein